MNSDEFKINNNPVSCCAGSNCCSGTGLKENANDTETGFEIIIDGNPAMVLPGDKNIVDVADRAKIGIPAPCYRDNHQKGCCKACLIEVNGKREYACATKPKPGMNITVKKDDLIEIRKQRIKEYKENIKNGSPCECSSASDCCG